MNEELDLNSIEQLQQEPDNSVVLAFTNYVREDLLRRSNGKLYGNWEQSFAGACISVFTNKYIHESSIIRKHKVGKCSSGKTIWAFEHH